MLLSKNILLSTVMAYTHKSCDYTVCRTARFEILKDLGGITIYIGLPNLNILLTHCLGPLHRAYFRE